MMKKQFLAFALALCLFTAFALADDLTGLDDLPWLTDSLMGEMDSALLTLANREHPLPADWVPAALAEIPRMKVEGDGGLPYAATSGTLLLQPEALEALQRLMSAAEKQGISLFVRQAYRSYAQEQALYERQTVAGSAEAWDPAWSDWRTGLSVALVGKAWRGLPLTELFGETEEALWLSAHCWEYGFILRYPRFHEGDTGHSWAPWQLRYVGQDAAEMMRLNNQCLEEFLADNRLQ